MSTTRICCEDNCNEPCHTTMHRGDIKVHPRCQQHQRAFWAARKRAQKGYRPKKPRSMICIIEGCDEPRIATHAWCREHYREYQRNWQRQRNNRPAKKTKRALPRENFVVIDEENKVVGVYRVTEVIDEDERELKRGAKHTLELLKRRGFRVAKIV